MQREHKIEKKNGDQDALNEMRALTCESNQETSKAKGASQHLVRDKLRKIIRYPESMDDMVLPSN